MGSLFFFYSTPAEAQFFKKLTKKLEKKLDNTAERLENKVDEKLDKMLDLEGEDQTSDPSQEMPNNNSSGMSDIGMSSEDGDYTMAEDEMYMETEDAVSFASYSKYDFAPGNTLVAFEDFSVENVGDFPSKWNTNSSAEVVTINTAEGKWLRIGQGKGTFTFSDIPNPLPEDFTIEFDMLFDFEADSYAFKRYFNVLLSDLENPDQYLSDFTPSKEFVSVSFYQRFWKWSLCWIA